MPKVTWTGDASSAERAANALAAAQKKVNEQFTAGAKGAKDMERAALAITKANEGPQEKYNRRLAEANELFKRGKISVDDLARATQRYQRELEAAGQKGKQAFGSELTSSLASAAGGFLSVGTAIGFVANALRDANARAREASDRDFRSRAGLGSLSQLAAGEDDPRAAFASLINEARQLQTIGAAVDDAEAGQILFELASAGLNRRDRGFAARLRAGGTLQNIGGAAQAFDALTTALGAQEVGSFQEFMSKALRAAGPAPGSFEQLPIAAAAAGGSARALGISDEFLLAATTLLGKQAGSIDEGGTLLAALLRQVEKAGRKDLQGLGGIGLIEKLASLPERQQGFGGILGDRAEAVSALRVLRENLPALRDLQGKVIAAQQGDLAGIAAGLPATDQRLAAAQAFARAKGRQQFTEGELLAERQSIHDAIVADVEAKLADSNFIARGFTLQGLKLRDRFGLETQTFREITGEETSSLATIGPNLVTPETRKRVEEYQRRAAEAAEATARMQRAKVTTRPE